MGSAVGVIVTLVVLWFLFAQFVVGPILKRKARRTYSLRDAGNMNYQAKATAKALAGELKRNAAETPTRPSAPATGVPVASINSSDLASQLKNLNELHQSGALTADEFQASKAKLLDKS